MLTPFHVPFANSAVPQRHSPCGKSACANHVEDEQHPKITKHHP